MKWKINYSRDAEKFIERENIRGETSEASPQTDENRMESISPQRRGARRDDSSFFFAADPAG